ncbi:MAG: biotin--[acetyl-CoA-carboxylase] ligase [Paludibacteraceae bacterium]|nr:biotin--[acetyl-CoA-carboxylase] ligase [Paludibacteraceae bacterium]
MYIAETNSTNDLLRQHPEYVTVRTDFQTSGRGQQGNGWESERGKNLLFSTLLLRPQIAVEQQFVISMAVCVALRQAVLDTVGADSISQDSPLCIKWPNDLYAGDRKLAGILIENTLSEGHIGQSIIGIGLNVNQQQWFSDAPNPTSLCLLTGCTYEPEIIMQAFLRNLSEIMQQPLAEIRSAYMDSLYRKTGFHLWEEREVNLLPTMNQSLPTNRSFEAHIADITDQGELLLRLRNGEEKTYHFKQVKYVINN